MTIKLFSLIAVFIGTLQACRTLPDPPGDRDIAGRYVQIKKGESLAVISRKYRVSVAEIKEINGITNERRLTEGQILYLPEPDPIGKRLATLNKAPKAPQMPSPPSSTKAPQSKGLFAFPVPDGTVVYHFSKEKKHPYEGIGIKAPLGTDVVAAQDGRVAFVGDDGTKYGLIVIVEHKYPFITVYAHLQDARVSANQTIKRGQALGTVGKSGGAAIPHLHFQVRVDKQPRDPSKYLRS